SAEEKQQAVARLDAVLAPTVTLSAPSLEAPLVGQAAVRSFWIEQLLPSVDKFAIRGTGGEAEIILDGAAAAVTVRGNFPGLPTAEVGELLALDPETNKIRWVTLFTDPAKLPGSGSGHASRTTLVDAHDVSEGGARAETRAAAESYYGRFLNPTGPRDDRMI